MNQLEEDSQLEGSPHMEPEVEGGSHKQVEVDNQLKVEWADQILTFAGLEEQPSSAGARTFHLSCPFQPCVVSACTHKPSNKQCQIDSSESEKLLGVLRFQQS